MQITCDGHEIEELIPDSDGNYFATFEFDDAWNGLSSTARFICEHGTYYSLINSDNRCIIPLEVIGCGGLVHTVVFADSHGESLVTTDPICTRVIRSIITDSRRSVVDQNPAIYTDILNAAEDALKIAQEVERRANDGEFNGTDGEDGGASEEVLDAIEKALDEIIDLQNSFIGLPAAEEAAF